MVLSFYNENNLWFCLFEILQPCKKMSQMKVRNVNNSTDFSQVNEKEKKRACWDDNIEESWIFFKTCERTPSRMLRVHLS